MAPPPGCRAACVLVASLLVFTVFPLTAMFGILSESMVLARVAVRLLPAKEIQRAYAAIRDALDRRLVTVDVFSRTLQGQCTIFL